MAYRFNDCCLDVARHEFTRDGKAVALEPQVFDLLCLFVGNAGQLISRDRIIDEIWRGRIVSDAAVSSRINAVRRVIGDDGKAQSMLRTVPRRGFRFVAEVTHDAGPADAEGDAALKPATPQVVRMVRSPDGTAIAYSQTGNGPPLLRAGHFLTHLELDWQSPVWRPLLDRFGSYFSLLRYDQRGTGLSDPAPPSRALDRMVDDLEAVANAAGLDRFPLFAASQGVPVSVAFCARNPGRVSRLVLYGGYAQGRGVRPGANANDEAAAIETIMRQGWGKAGSAFGTAFASLYMPDATREQLQHMVQMQNASATSENAVALRHAIDRFDVMTLMGQVQVPTLVLHAREDSVHPVAQAGVLAAGLPDATLHVFEGRNHIPLPQDAGWAKALDAALHFLAG